MHNFHAVKKSSSSTSAKKVEAKIMPVSTAVEEFTPYYLAPVEMVDDPSAWDSEEYYFGQAPAVSPEKPWYEKLIDIYGVIQARKEAQRFREENLKRLRAGQPPLSVEAYKSISPPAATVEVGLSPQVKNMLLIGSLGLGSLLLFNMLRR